MRTILCQETLKNLKLTFLNFKWEVLPIDDHTQGTFSPN